MCLCRPAGSGDRGERYDVCWPQALPHNANRSHASLAPFRRIAAKYCRRNQWESGKPDSL